MSLNAAQQIHQSLSVNTSRPGSGDNWDEIRDNLEPRAQKAIAESSWLCNEMGQTCIKAGVSDADFITQAKGTMRDIGHYRDRHLALVRQRGDRTGPTKDDKDYTDYTRIGMEHVALHQEMGVIVGQGLIALSQYQERAAKILAEQDRNTVTDVEPKEPTEQPAEQEQAQA